MATTNWQSEIRLTADLSTAEQAGTQREHGAEQPFVIVVLGDFQGRTQDATPAGATPLGERRVYDIDRDTFDTVLERFNVEWRGALEGLPGQPETALPLQIALRTFEDFLPDRLVEQIVPLRALLETRRGLESPSQFDAVAAEVMAWAKQAPAQAPPPASSSPPESVPDLEPSELLDRILEGSSPRVDQPSRDAWAGDLQRFLGHVVSPHLVTIDTRLQTALIDAVDEALSQQMRAVLHHPEFQRLESLWRSLWWLVNAAETGMDLKLRLVQVSREDLQEDLTTSPTLEGSGLARLFLEPASIPGTAPIALMIGAYEFAHTADDVALLQRLGSMAQKLRAPFVAAASPHLFGGTAFTTMTSGSDLARQFQDPAYESWHTLRRAPETSWLALALPRLLLRLPYGAETEPVETFAFEEQVAGADHDHLLWGNPAFAVGAVVAQAFAEQHWALDLAGRVHRLEGLPLYIWREDGMAVVKPCAEVLLTERIVEFLEENGFVPLISYRDTDMVALPCLQVLGTPPAPLRWTLSG